MQRFMPNTAFIKNDEGLLDKCTRLATGIAR